MNIDMNKFNRDGFFIVKSLLDNDDIKEMELSLNELLNEAMSIHFPSTNIVELDSKWLFFKEKKPTNRLFKKRDSHWLLP